MPNDELDQGAVNLAKAIREVESRGNWNAKGASGEWGGYQFMPDTWKAYSSEFGVNAAFGSATPEQQNEVAYKKIKQWKDQGYDVGQIASMWNAGPGRPNAYKEGWKGTTTLPDGRKVSYDTPAYAEKVANAYQVHKAQSKLLNRDTELAPALKQDAGAIEGMGRAISESGNKLSQAYTDTVTGEINPLSGLIRGAGALGSGVTGVTDEAIKAIPLVGKVVEGAEKLVGLGAEKLMQTAPGQAVGQAAQRFSEAHPELAGDIGAAADIATAVPVLRGLGKLRSGVKGAVSDVLHGKSDPVLDMVSKDLTPKELAEAVSTRGIEKRGLLGETVLREDPRDIAVADTVKKYAKVDPGRGFLHNIVEVQRAERKLNQKIKTEFTEAAGDRIYSYREFTSLLNNIERPVMLRSDATLNNAFNRVIAKATEIAKKKKGRVANLLEVRQEFDRYVKKEFPNLYKSEQLTPLRLAVKKVRDAITDFTVKALPEESTLRADMLDQHRLITAIEEMSRKATKGEGKELGLTYLDRAARKHPKVTGLLKVGAQAAIQGAGLGGVMRI